MICSHKMRKLCQDEWVCTKCGKHWISYEEGNSLHQQNITLRARIKELNQTQKQIMSRVNTSLKESGIMVIE